SDLGDRELAVHRGEPRPRIGPLEIDLLLLDGEGLGMPAHPLLLTQSRLDILLPREPRRLLRLPARSKRGLPSAELAHRRIQRVEATARRLDLLAQQGQFLAMLPDCPLPAHPPPIIAHALPPPP